MTPALLEVRGLTKHFPLRAPGLRRGPPALLRAVDGVSFELAPGESLGLVGESGCGKSTLARLLLGLVPPTSGSVRHRGEELVGLDRKAWLPHRRRIQMVFQDPFASLNPRQRAGEILAEPMEIHGLGDARERRLRALHVMEAVGLGPRLVGSYPHELSGGQRQRLGIARALTLEPELLVCDEPVSSLDVSVQAQIVNLLLDLRERFGLALLFISHDLAVVARLCERVAVMYLGKLVEIGDRRRTFEDPQHPYTRALLSAAPLPDPARERGRERILLGGEVPSPVSPPCGCAFHPRCPERARVEGDRCRRESPVLAPRGEATGRLVACHLS